MQTQPRQLIPAQYLTSSLATYYTGEAGKNTIISKLTLTNVSAGVDNVDVHIVASGDTATAENRVLSQKALDSNQSFPVYQLEGQILKAGDTIQAKADNGTAVVIMASGVAVF